MNPETPLSTNNEWMTNGTFFDQKYVLEHTKVPDDIADIPDVIGLSGPARSGSTAMLFLMASQDGVDRAYFQPQKTLIRQGGPDYELRPTDKLVFTKEVFGILHPEELYDPIDNLLKAGVPPEKITWITTLRNPVDSYASWYSLSPGATPELYARSQAHTLALYAKYKDLITSIPFAYDLLQEGTLKVLQAVLAKTALSEHEINLSFNNGRIAERVELGQARDPAYYEYALAATAARGSFSYQASRKSIPENLENEIIKSNMSAYEEFYLHSKNTLGIR